MPSDARASLVELLLELILLSTATDGIGGALPSWDLRPVSTTPALSTNAGVYRNARQNAEHRKLHESGSFYLISCVFQCYM